MDEVAILKKMLGKLQQAENVKIGPGDDAAVLSSFKHEMVVTADPVIEGVHFTPGTSAEWIAKKLVRRNLSDLAAMGARVRYGILTIAIKNEHAESFLELFFNTMAQEAQTFDFSIVGGDLTKLPHPGFIATLTLIGEAQAGASLLRSTAQVGDLICVSGVLGNSFESGHHLNFEPQLQLGEWLCANKLATSMIDISDGLLMDLSRVCHASKCGAQLDTTLIPLRTGASLNMACMDGEDYELLFTINPHSQYKMPSTIHVIGSIIAEQVLIDQHHTPLMIKGYNPFLN